MDILLAHAFFLRFDPKQWASMQPYAPLGTLFAASYLRQQGYRVGLFDSMLARGPDDLITVLEQHRPKMVVFHEDNFNWLSKMCLTRMREACFEMMKHVKKHLGVGIPVVVAGSDATDHRELYFEKGADYVIIGESEQTLTELANYLLDHSPAPPEQIAGLALKTGHAIHRTAPRGFIKNLDLLPMPAWDLIDFERYRQAWRRKHGYYSINLVTTRGCPFKCNWCAKPIYGNRYNCRSPENVVEEMVWLKRHVQPDHIWFADDIFGLKPGWVEHFGELVEAAGVAIPYKIQARVDLLSEQVVQGLKKSGCKTVWVGAESGSQKILDAMEKGTTVEQIYAATRRLRRHGIEVCFFLQFGYPGEGDEEIEKTLQMVRECQPDDIGISVSYPLPGTKFYETVKNAMGPKQNWEHSNDLALMFPGKYHPDFYRQLHRVVHLEFRMRKAARDFARLWRRPQAFRPASLRRLAGAFARLPVFYAEKLRLNQLKIPNQSMD